MKYKNCGYITKEFYGITFNPGDIHEVPGFIAAQHFVRVEDEITSADNAAEISKPRRGRPPKSQSNDEHGNKGSEKESLMKTELVQETVEDKTSKDVSSKSTEKEKD